MPPKDSNRLTPRQPVLGALRSGVGGIFRLVAGRRKWKMHALETERLLLRAFDPADLKNVIAWGDFSIGENAEEHAQEFLAYCFREYRERGIGPWGMEWKQTKTIVGNCGFPHINKQCGEVNCYLAPRHRGLGLAHEALRALFEFGFREIGLNRIQARCELSNISAQRLAEKAEMKFEGFVEDAPSAKNLISRQKMFVIFRREFDLASGRMPDARSRTATRSENEG